GQPIQLTNSPGDDTDPTLSPDGTFIVFTSTRDGNPELYLMDYDGEFPTRLTNAPTIQRRPAISPDGTQIAYESDETGNNEVYTMPLASRAPVRVTNNPANDGDPTWVPGPQPRLVYTSDR
ncbi:MAG: PD40 domain-containing protein, partial [Anaerolineales bacterium]|nr:PD40 domain-containing protein [Anaerolineales bacterium]